MLKMKLSTLIFRSHTVDLSAFIYERVHAEKRCIGFAQIFPQTTSMALVICGESNYPKI